MDYLNTTRTLFGCTETIVAIMIICGTSEVQKWRVKYQEAARQLFLQSPENHQNPYFSPPPPLPHTKMQQTNFFFGLKSVTYNFLVFTNDLVVKLRTNR